MTRRELLRAGLYGAASTFRPTRNIALRLNAPRPKSLHIAVITDLHHGLARDAKSRLEAFVSAVHKRKHIDFTIQMGDFCYSQPDSKEVLDLWSQLSMPKLHVLGNHDMDKCDKNAAIRCWGMKHRYYASVIGGYRFVVLDLNHFKKDGKLVSYASGNYFTDGAACNWADPEQLEWLDRELRSSREPVILISHQPLGFAVPGQSLPAEQVEVLNVISSAAEANPRGAVAACLCGHMHVDWLQSYEQMPCYCVNSASYFWYNGMQPYSKPLYAFLEITPTGELRVEGIQGEFLKPPPKASDIVPGRSASISSQNIPLRSHSLSKSGI